MENPTPHMSPMSRAAAPTPFPGRLSSIRYPTGAQRIHAIGHKLVAFGQRRPEGPDEDAARGHDQGRMSQTFLTTAP